jgi:CobQ-like glutamine amidotransferase family enzyme
MTVSVVRLFPELTNSQGDAENALVLSAALSWAGVPASIVDVDASTKKLPQGNIFILGHVVPSDVHVASEALSRFARDVRSQVEAGARLLVVGTGIELAITMGLLTGETTGAEHSVGDLFVQTSSGSTYWGFENSLLGYRLGEGELSLGKVLVGHGNGDGTEGVLREVGRGLVIGTHLHGPVLQRNLALLRLVVGPEIDVDWDDVFANHPIASRVKRLNSTLRESRARESGITVVGAGA